jgi:hypothetical protein
MRVIENVDCGKCSRLDTLFCDNCIHSINDPEDYYDELPFQEIQKRQQEEHQEMEGTHCNQFIKLQLTQEFKSAFNTAKNALKDCFYPKYLTILTRQKDILFCDPSVLFLYYATVPVPLRNKKLATRMDDNGVYISHQETFWDKGIEKTLLLLLGKPPISQCSYNALEIKYGVDPWGDKIAIVNFEKTSLKIPERNLKKINSVLEESSVGRYNDNNRDAPYLVFTSPLGKAITYCKYAI